MRKHLFVFLMMSNLLFFVVCSQYKASVSVREQTAIEELIGCVHQRPPKSQCKWSVPSVIFELMRVEGPPSLY